MHSISSARFWNHFSKNQQIWRHFCVSFCAISWLNIREKNLIPLPPRFHLSSKPGFCMLLTLNSTKMYWYKGIICVCPAFKVYNHFCRHKTTFLRELFIPAMAKWRQAVSTRRSHFSSYGSDSQKGMRLTTLLIDVTLPSSLVHHLLLFFTSW